jgi:hypothetical protein
MRIKSGNGKKTKEWQEDEEWQDAVLIIRKGVPFRGVSFVVRETLHKMEG